MRYQVSDDGRFEGGEGQLDALTRFQARRAGEWFDRGLELVPLLDRRSGACVLAMANIYRGVLRAHRRRPRALADGARVAADLGEGVGGKPQHLTAALGRPPVRDRRWQLP